MDLQHPVHLAQRCLFFYAVRGTDAEAAHAWMDSLGGKLQARVSGTLNDISLLIGDEVGHPQYEHAFKRYMSHLHSAEPLYPFMRYLVNQFNRFNRVTTTMEKEKEYRPTLKFKMLMERNGYLVE